MMKDPFPIRTYGILELGVLYFPTITPRLVSRQLVRWMHACNPLWTELQQSGFVTGQRLMISRQVEIIVKHISTPE